MNDDLMIKEFKIEAAEMFESAEDGLLNIDKGLDFISNYNSIFRSFHSLKGAAGMFGMEELQLHMHKLESLLEAQKKYGVMNKNQIDYFLYGIDGAKSLIDGNATNFVHVDLEKFNIEIPVASLISPEIPKNAPIKTEKIIRKNGVVFIVDDEPELVDILSRIIEQNNYVVYKFYNGEEAVNSFEKYKPDIILSDILMPKLNGIEMIKAIHEVSANTPVIFISGNLSKERMQEALQFGAYAFIDKPFDNLTVKNLCRNAVKKSQALNLLEKSINYILYQFSDLDEYLKSTGKESLRQGLKAELKVILEQKKILKDIS
ncbi:MAG: response regulator [Bacteriovorax sp.]|nr:response regulator [Bacteriovorax sp.]